MNPISCENRDFHNTYIFLNGCLNKFLSISFMVKIHWVLLINLLFFGEFIQVKALTCYRCFLFKPFSISKHVSKHAILAVRRRCQGISIRVHRSAEAFSSFLY